MGISSHHYHLLGNNFALFLHRRGTALELADKLDVTKHKKGLNSDGLVD